MENKRQFIQSGNKFKIKVAARIRPIPLKEENVSSNISHQNNENKIDENQKHFQKQISNQGEQLQKEGNMLGLYDIFQQNSSQEQLYSDFTQSQVRAFQNGYDCTLLAYGQTGSGKTHTIFGPPKSITYNSLQNQSNIQKNKLSSSLPSDWGIFPRAMFLVHQNVKSLNQSGKEASLKLSAVEVYMERTYDLLDNNKEIFLSKTKIWDNSSANPDKPNYDKNGKWVNPWYQEQANSKASASFAIKGQKDVDIKDFQDVINITKTVEACRTSAGHNVNARSSRSHCLITATLIVKKSLYQNSQSKEVQTSKFQFVDLAGSERLKSSGVKGQNAKEASATNLSLTTLGRVINAIVEKQPVIPYRDSTLTMLMKKSFNGNTQTSMIVTLSSDPQFNDESILTLKFGKRCSGVSNIAIQNKVSSENQSNKYQISQLEQKLSQAKNELKQMDEKGKGGYIDSSAYKCIKDSYYQNKKLLDQNKDRIFQLKLELQENVSKSKNIEQQQQKQQNDKQKKAIEQQISYCEAEYTKYNGIIERMNFTGLYTPAKPQYIQKQAQIQDLENQLAQLK